MIKIERNANQLRIIGAKSYDLFMHTATDTTNCKLSYIHGAGTLNGLEEKVMKEVIDGILGLPETKGCCILNTTYKKVADFIYKAYPTYYYHSVPIGYGVGYQYHICFKNVIRPHYSCRKPEASDKTGIKEKLLAILKAKRRKNDYVDEFINSLQ